MGHYRAVHVKSLAAHSMRTIVVARMQLVSLRIANRGHDWRVLKMYGLLPAGS